MTVLPLGTVTPVTAPSATTSTSATGAADGNAFTRSLGQVQQSLDQADALGQQLATGGLQDLHTFMAAATKATTEVQLTVAVRDKAVEAYQEIMRMQI